MCTIAAAPEVVLPLDGHARDLARDFLREVLCRPRCAAVGDEAELLVCEVFTNGLRCGTPPLAPPLSVPVDRGSPSWLRIAVSDACSTQPVPRTAREQDGDGRGMALVDFVSKARGVQTNGSGTTVRFCPLF